MTRTPPRRLPAQISGLTSIQRSGRAIQRQLGKPADDVHHRSCQRREADRIRSRGLSSGGARAASSSPTGARAVALSRSSSTNATRPTPPRPRGVAPGADDHLHPAAPQRCTSTMTRGGWETREAWPSPREALQAPAASRKPQRTNRPRSVRQVADRPEHVGRHRDSPPRMRFGVVTREINHNARVGGPRTGFRYRRSASSTRGVEKIGGGTRHERAGRVPARDPRHGAARVPATRTVPRSSGTWKGQPTRGSLPLRAGLQDIPSARHAAGGRAAPTSSPQRADTKRGVASRSVAVAAPGPEAGRRRARRAARSESGRSATRGMSSGLRAEPNSGMRRPAACAPRPAAAAHARGRPCPPMLAAPPRGREPATPSARGAALGQEGGGLQHAS